MRCALHVALDDGQDEEPAAAVLRYGHFEVSPGYDGLPAELGRGAMGTTYKALDTVLHAPVALKVIDRNVSALPVARARFLREARATARLHHPNVASVTFYGEQDGECFYAMELVEGETLAERVRRAGTFPALEAMEIGVQVARALAAAETLGVVHRDLKPSNLMLVGAPLPTPTASRLGRVRAVPALHVKVIDWGLAKAVNAEDPLLGADQTRGGFVGTPAFASPEQFAGMGTRRVDIRSDIYSLGVTLWYLLCGKTPFVGDTLEAIHARQRRLPTHQLKAARVPDCFAKVLRSMVAFDPADRAQSARELLDTLVHCQRGYLDEDPASTRRRHSLWITVALALLVLSVVGAAIRWNSVRPSRASAPADRPSLAVLPFENAGGDPADAFFTVGMQDEINNDLARIAALDVVQAESSRAYPSGHRDLPEIGRELGVRYLLEGNVRRQEDRLRIEVHLSDLRDPGHPWSETYTRRPGDVFAVQGEITRDVAARLRAALSDAEKAAVDRPPTSDLAAYDLYLRARDETQTFQSAEDRYRHALETTVPLLEEAVRRDPQFAFASAALASAYDGLVPYELDKGQAELADRHRAQASAALAKAVRLRPDAGEVHLAQAARFYQLEQNYEQATQELELARRALPNNAPVEELAGRMAREQNRWSEAVRCLERATVLAPRNNEQRFYLANTYRFLRRFEDADREAARVIASLPADRALAFRMYRAIGRLEERADLTPLRAVVDAAGTPDPTRMLVTLKARLLIALDSHDATGATALLAEVPETGLVWGGDRLPKAWFEALAARLRHDEAAARDAFTRARTEEERLLLADPSNGHVLSMLAMIDAGLGHEEEAVREGLHACELTPVETLATSAPVVACHLAVVYAWTNQPDRACQTLEPWLDRPAGDSLVRQPMYGDFRLNPVWDPLQGDPRFASLVARLAPGAVPTAGTGSKP